MDRSPLRALTHLQVAGIVRTSPVEMDRSPLRALTHITDILSKVIQDVEMDRSPLRALMNEKEFKKANYWKLFG